MLFNEFFSIQTLEEATNVLDQLSTFHTLHDFFNQNKSPYYLLQIVLPALITIKNLPGDSLEEIEHNPELLASDKNKRKLMYLFSTTNFARDFNLLFKQAFPESSENPADWANLHKVEVTNLNSKNIQTLLSLLQRKYGS